MLELNFLICQNEKMSGYDKGEKWSSFGHVQSFGFNIENLVVLWISSTSIDSYTI